MTVVEDIVVREIKRGRRSQKVWKLEYVGRVQSQISAIARKLEGRIRHCRYYLRAS